MRSRALPGFFMFAWHGALAELLATAGSHKTPDVTGRKGNADPACSGTSTVRDEADRLWDVDEPDRFARLAIHHPELLTHDEQIKWKLIRENGYLWRGRMNDGLWIWQVKEGGLILERLRKYWDKFCAVSVGDEDASVLPTWNGKTRVEPDPPMPETDFSNGIPF